MSQSFWESETVEEAQPEQQPQEQQPSTPALALSVDDFSALEERILRAVELLKKERQARVEAEKRAEKLDSQLREQAALAERQEGELNTLRAEREHVRQRVDRLLAQLDTLEI